MPAQLRACYVAVCDVPGCGYEYDENAEFVGYYDTPEEAVEHATEEAWDPSERFTLLRDGRLACPKQDAAHDTARRVLAALPGQLAIAPVLDNDQRRSDHLIS
ncbi:hypothetical protein [Streptomyces hoynatensis]|uniref:Uncharacterized protein n=1 Tax=Streptomyces hoynatensis TaxID=1141874 RepID=A0A3A9YYK6_9ACTN|nr:hypothetical protein [Streptomyces hoynatensis]RKN40794.1 hypothetical protein D7294_17040 [Streptomyces hoynatensis]